MGLEFVAYGLGIVKFMYMENHYSLSSMEI